MSEINHVAWSRSMVTFIREKGLEDEFRHWCGGWPCGVDSAVSPILVNALEMMRGFGCPVCSGDCGSANPPVASCPMATVESALAKARQSHGGLDHG